MSVVLRAGTALAAAASAAAWAAPKPTDIQGLEAKVRAQDDRIRQLEDQVQRLLARVPDPQPASAQAPPPGASAPAPAQSEAKASGEGEEVTIKLRGRVQVDASLGSGEDVSFGTQIRRFYLGAEGKLGGGFRYLAEADFAGNDVSLQDVLIGYEIDPDTELVVGHFKPSNTNDDLTSDVHTLFLERSAYASVFAPGRRIGAGVHHAGRDWGVRVGLFGEREDRALDTDRAEAWLASGRVHADLLPGDDVLHVAVSGYYSEPSSSERSVRITQKPELNRAPTVLDTGVFDPDHGMFGGAELAFAHGPFTVQAEGGALSYEGATAGPLFWGVSAQASWRWTGESRPYDVASGTFGRVKPDRSFADGGAGAFETGVRFTHVDLDDGNLLGGRLTTYGIVLNWFPVTRVRVSGNFIHAETDRLIGPDLKHNLFAVRGAVDW
ncbi:porin [Sphingomonas sp. LY54]|uniref:OprO/OprP family phosphate-selective porin n=1 Tax=Sphingomonas sp. LY54 TaxID=3095343 RepID=UPI002D78B5DD|nr:porin [Sphingomonas sp. LY54]WRP27739.1 porin [Sphingomonas sp. LY54]